MFLPFHVHSRSNFRIYVILINHLFIMRFSTIVAFMLPLAALAAPLAPRDRLSVRDQIVRGFDQARRGLRSAFRLANGLNIAQPTVVQLIQEVQIAEIKSALDVVIQQIDQGGAVGVSEYVNTPHWFTITIMTRRLFLQRGHASSAGRNCQSQGGADHSKNQLCRL